MTPTSSGRPLRLLLLAVLALALVISGTSTAEAAKRRVSVSLDSGTRAGLKGDRVRVTGVASAPARSTVSLQRKVGSSWRTAASTRTTSVRRFGFDVTLSSTASFRVRYAGSRSYAAAVSRSFTLSALSCTSRSAPANGTEVLFNRPGGTGASTAARKIAQTICSAQRGSRIDIAMYFIRYYASSWTEANLIVDSLERMARYRGVKVRVLLEGRLVRPGLELRASYLKLRTFADVVTCDFGCHSVVPVSTTGGTQGIQHHKFMTITDMRWAGDVDPLVLSSTGNWSRAQFNNNWQSTVLQYDDPVLTREFRVQFEQLLSCADASRCGSWATARRSFGATAEGYTMTLGNGVWAEPSAERPGTAGRGSSVSFSPQHTSDRMAYALERFSCTATHRTVRVAQMFVTPSRPRILDALARLQAQGCDVRVVVNQPVGTAQTAGVARMLQDGLNVRCTTGVHEKLIAIDGVDGLGRVDRSIWTGAQNLGYNALRRNDEAVLRLSTAAATGTSRTAIAGAHTAYLGYWDQMRATTSRCATVPSTARLDPSVVGPGTAELSRLADSLTSDPDDVVPPQ
ncbi:phospholipase D-like domain-containing protein [Nocardioides aurantiacus]|uniref:phospholipase D n=1 Tax=Nocardioides aurantiacus TaxID=86796 RepID=A0A3N2CX64_9ACTN|nr:phospholipase D-like domain-containing protein [Nocardioides aurantiacus]ROR92132.1 phospholipase D-like protein [Nocardioides aurantiacus]